MVVVWCPVGDDGTELKHGWPWMDDFALQAMQYQVISMLHKHVDRVKQCSSIILVVLSHGKHGRVVGVDGSEVGVAELIRPMIE